MVESSLTHSGRSLEIAGFSERAWFEAGAHFERRVSKDQNHLQFPLTRCFDARYGIEGSKASGFLD